MSKMADLIDDGLRVEITRMPADHHAATVELVDPDRLNGWLSDTLYTQGNRAVIIVADGLTVVYRGLG